MTMNKNKAKNEGINKEDQVVQTQHEKQGF